MTDCVIVQPIAHCGVAHMRAAGLALFEAPTTDLATLKPHLRTARAVITRNHGFSAEAIAAAPHLRVIAAHGTGTDRIDKQAAASRGISVLNTPGANANAVAEHALALIFACSRQIVSADAALRAGDWAFRNRAQPLELCNRRLGLVGWGHVARALARLATGIGMEVRAFSRHATEAELARTGVDRSPDLDTLLAGADVVSLHGSPQSGPLLGAAQLARMKPGALLVNTARGSLIDETALARALHEGHLAAAALDVFAQEPLPPESPLRTAPNLVLTPHIAGLGPDASDRTARAVAELVIEALGLPLPVGSAP